MNCKSARHHLLLADRPDRLALTIGSHVAACPACEAFQQRLLRLELDVRRLPVPATNGKATLLARLAREPLPVRDPASTPSPRTRLTLTPRQDEANRPPRWLRFFGSPALPPATLAASLLIFAFLWWLLYDARQDKLASTFPGKPTVTQPAADLLLANLMKRNLELATADKPGRRVEVLADMASDLQDMTKVLAQVEEADDLAALAEMFGHVLDDGLLPRAEALAREERTHVLAPIAERLGKTKQEIDTLAASAPTPLKKALGDLASAAEKGNTRLKALARGEEAR